MLSPKQAIENGQVWLRYFDGFGPEDWGFIGFTEEKDRRSILNAIDEGALFVIVGTTEAADPREHRRIIGILQISKTTGKAQQFMSPDRFEKKQVTSREKDKWMFALAAHRAWRLKPEQYPTVEEFANETWTTGRARRIGAVGMKLTVKEAEKLKTFDLKEVPVFGQPPVDKQVFKPNGDALSPSRPGPVSQSSFWVEPAEGPKHLYLLKMTGKPAIFLNDKNAFGKLLIKPGFSSDPEKRCASLNSSFPSNSAFLWTVHTSTSGRSMEPFATSGRAKVGEKAMQDAIQNRLGGSSLGGEFFLLDPKHIDAVLQAGIDAAEAHRE
jgi:hypothetical protein